MRYQNQTTPIPYETLAEVAQRWRADQIERWGRPEPRPALVDVCDVPDDEITVEIPRDTCEALQFQAFAGV
jgi:hypothetical protein